MHCLHQLVLNLIVRFQVVFVLGRKVTMIAVVLWHHTAFFLLVPFPRVLGSIQLATLPALVDLLTEVLVLILQVLPHQP